MSQIFTPEEVAALRMSFLRFIPVSDQVADTLYASLFERSPELKALFHEDQRRQEEKLVHTLATMIDLIEKPEEFREYARSLGDRHRGYGVENDMYEPLGGLLVKALERHLAGLSEAEAELWKRLYDVIAYAMRS